MALRCGTPRPMGVPTRWESGSAATHRLCDSFCPPSPSAPHPAQHIPKTHGGSPMYRPRLQATVKLQGAPPRPIHACMSATARSASRPPPRIPYCRPWRRRRRRQPGFHARFTRPDVRPNRGSRPFSAPSRSPPNVRNRHRAGSPCRHTMHSVRHNGCTPNTFTGSPSQSYSSLVERSQTSAIISAPRTGTELSRWRRMR